MPSLCRTIKRLLPLAFCFLLLNLLLQDDIQRDARQEAASKDKKDCEGTLGNDRQKKKPSEDEADWENTLGNKRLRKGKLKDLRRKIDALLENKKGWEATLGNNRLRETKLKDSKQEGTSGWEATLGNNKQREATLDNEEDRGPRGAEKQREAGVKSDSLSPPDWFERRDTKTSGRVESPQSALRFSGASSIQGVETENIPASPSHPRHGLQLLPLWMRISDDLYTYSAFWDAREGLPSGPAVRVLGILRYHKKVTQEAPGYQWSGVVREEALKYSCFLWRTGRQAEEGQLSAFIYEEGLKTFVGTYFFCSPKNVTSNTSADSHDKMQVPYAVSLVPHSVSNRSQQLIYLRHDTGTVQGQEGHSGAVCVRPLFGPYTDVAAIALFMSYYNTVLSVSHFYFYDFAIDKKVREFLAHVLADGKVSIHLLPWNIPTSEWEELWDLGSLTATNDCVYRASGQHGHLAIVDLDEFIVPRGPATSLAQLYEAVIRHKHGTHGDAVLVLNAFFCSEFQQNKTGSSEEFAVFQATMREPRLWPARSRSKMVVVPEAAVAVGHHMVHRFLQPAAKNQASPKLVAVLHHYRHCAGVRAGIHAKGSEVVRQKPLMDKAILRYKSAVLASTIMRQYRHFTLN